ncbi:platelet-activating factor acetylhydrolase isoform II [Stackebrandtia albiflava]|uniref:Platelet-activating factor acetylhydrolase isoform II n=1 Tax=Stackebrandtia albiflava TaxID=406432 RepID=A0A562V453_9ACTN|nr:alpha/beta hydrolase [Stackebrandtia albiflava]TWJ12656.1 platelet-activating factor acetylhydrolase isoform II [Stackebrandtia albiflava]
MRRRLAAVTAGAALAIALPVSAWAEPAEGPSVTPPSNSVPVGTTDLHLVDEDRIDPWSQHGPRELMVTMFYPAAWPSGEPGGYFTSEESAAYVAMARLDIPADTFHEVTTQSHRDAPLRFWDGPMPLVVLSPGFSMPRDTLTGLGQELASQGYLVAAIGHDHEAAATTFPDGRTSECLACSADPDGHDVTEVRADDVSFVLDRLTGRHPAWYGGHLIDEDRIAMVGHSIGGASALTAMARDDRIAAGVNMDGSLHAPADGGPLPGTDRPFLLIGNPNQEPGGEKATWADFLPGLTGWRAWLTVDGMTHSSFTDFAPLADDLDIPLQELPGARCDEITRAYVSAFLAEHLHGEDRPLLDGPSPEFPEVRFW